MSAGPDPQVDITLIEQARKHINRLAEEIAHLSEQDLDPAGYYGEFMQRVMAAIAAPAGAIWLRTAQGNLQLQYQINLRQVGIDKNEESRKTHDELLRQAIMKGQPGFFPPRSGVGAPENGGPAAGNPTDFVILLAPIMVEKQVAGVIEIWQDPNRGPESQRGFLAFLVRMAGFAGAFTRNYQLRQMTGQQAVWTQLEAFARHIHGTLNPTEVAYLVANEGRRMVECDRVSVAVRRGKKTAVEAISGADVVEKRSNLVQLMRTLFDRVILWGEKLVYTGIKDDTLPPEVLKALDKYLAESNSKVLCILPLRDERETNKKKPGRSALMMESFEPVLAPDQLVARLEVVGKHANTALYNSIEHRRIPMRFVWAPLAKVQEGLGGKARAILFLILALIIGLTAVLVLVPATLKMEAKGTLLPKNRALVYSEAEGHVISFAPGVVSGEYVPKGKDLIQMYDERLGREINELLGKLQAATEKESKANADLVAAKNNKQISAEEKARIISEIIDAKTLRSSLTMTLKSLQGRTNANLRNPGEFWVKAPMGGMILSSDFRETFTNRRVRPNEPLLRLGQAGPRLGDWEVELKIPQKHIGQVLAAYPTNNPKAKLEVDLLLISAPTTTYKGILYRDQVSPEANPVMDDNNEVEPVVIARVQIDHPDIAKDDRMPTKLLLTGTEVHAKIRCGKHALGYTLFYGVWEFFYEKIVFFF